MDPDLAAAIAASLQDQQQSRQHTPTRSVSLRLFEWQCTCGTSLFCTEGAAAPEPAACASCGDFSLRKDGQKERLNPVVAASRSPRCIVIRATVGGLATALAEAFLHVGVTTSDGTVANFDERGSVLDPATKWDECIAIPLSSGVSIDDATWDLLVTEFQASYPHEYHSVNCNCFHYVVEFLNLIGYDGRSDHDRFTVVDSFLSQAITSAQAHLARCDRLNHGGGSGGGGVAASAKSVVCEPFLRPPAYHSNHKGAHLAGHEMVVVPSTLLETHMKDAHAERVCSVCGGLSKEQQLENPTLVSSAAYTEEQRRNNHAVTFTCAAGCPFGVCLSCMWSQSPGVVVPQRQAHPHPLVVKPNGGKYMPFSCDGDGCDNSGDATTLRGRCVVDCDYDLCEKCINKTCDTSKR